MTDRHEGTGDLRKRLDSWVAEKISGKRYAQIADAQIEALQARLFERHKRAAHHSRVRAAAAIGEQK